MLEHTDDTDDDRESESEGLDAQPGAGNPVEGEDVGAGAGARKAAATPPIADDANKGETQHPAPDDDVGVPDDPGADKEG